MNWGQGFKRQGFKRQRFKRTGIAVSVAALLVVGAACSETDKDEGSTKSTEAKSGQTTRTTRGVTDDTIKVGGTVFSLFFGDAGTGVEARIKEANDAGGVHGRKIEFVGAEDNGEQADASLEITKRLVEQEQVFALLPVMSATYGGGDYIVDNNVPTFGWGVNPAFCGVQVSFGVTGCVTDPNLKVGSNALGTSLVDHFDGNSDKTVAFIAEDNDAGRGGLQLLTASVADKGFEVVAEEASLPAPPDPLGDPSPFVSKLMTSASGGAPDIIYLQSTLNASKIAAALQAAEYKGMIITPQYSPVLLGQPGYDDIYINTQFSMDPEIEANKKMMEAVEAVKPGTKMSLSLSAGYWAADMFIEALEQTGQDLTVESFLATLNGGDFTYEAPGVIGKSTWPANHDKSVPCSAITKVENKQFVPLLPLTCGENIEIG